MIIKSLSDLRIFTLKVGKNIKSKKCFILLYGDIGVGKTTFARELINYFQKKNSRKLTNVPSPTFNIMYEYDLKKFKIYHYDLYKLVKTEEIEELGLLTNHQNDLKIVEWPNLIRSKIKDKIEINLKYRKRDSERSVKIRGYGRFRNFNLNEI